MEQNKEKVTLMIEETYVHIHPAWFAGMCVFFSAMVGVLWNQHNRRLAKLEDSKVDIGHCKLKEQLAKTKFAAQSQRMLDLNESNRRDYTSMMTSIHELCESQKTTNRELGDISKCLALLAAGVDCTDVQTEHKG